MYSSEFCCVDVTYSNLTHTEYFLKFINIIFSKVCFFAFGFIYILRGYDNICLKYIIRISHYKGRLIVSLNNEIMKDYCLGLREIELKEEYRSDKDDIVSEFFLPCLSNCIEYDRCVDFLSIQTLATISMAFDNFSRGKSKLRMITGHRFRTSDLNLLKKLFSEKFTKSFEGKLIKDTKIQKLQDIVNNGQIELKIAIPNSEQVANLFSERIGIFTDEHDQTVAFTGTSRESFSTQIRDFESVDVFTSWNDKSRVERKMKDFEDLWENMTKYVEVYDFMYAEENNLLKYSSEWIIQD